MPAATVGSLAASGSSRKRYASTSRVASRDMQGFVGMLVHHRLDRVSGCLPRSDPGPCRVRASQLWTGRPVRR